MEAENRKGEVIEVHLNNTQINRNQPNLPLRRRAILGLYPDTVEVTISVIAFNRLEITKACIESILKYTQGINYKLILVYNENEQGDGILEYFHSVDYANKLVIHINANSGLALATKELLRHMEGKYYVGLANDTIVTENWLSNLIKCAESDASIGMVVPMSSNVTNMQRVDLNFSNYEEMQQEAAKFNCSNPKKWEERLRLVTISPLITRDCLEAIGAVFDLGFFHDFADDELSFRIRRSGYKCMLAGDTWVHHDHDSATRDPEKLAYSMNQGINNFKEKYYGLDSWRDTNNLHMEFVNAVSPCEASKPRILGLDVKCGAPILQIKNKLRTFGVFEAELFAFTRQPEFYLDLQTICGSDHVICGEEGKLLSYYVGQTFDYIVIGEVINAYDNPIELIKWLSQFLSDNGQMFLTLKNVQDIFWVSQLLGYPADGKNVDYRNLSSDELISQANGMGLNIRHIVSYLHGNMPVSQEELANIIESMAPFAKVSQEEIRRRLVINTHAYVITKNGNWD